MIVCGEQSTRPAVFQGEVALVIVILCAALAWTPRCLAGGQPRQQLEEQILWLDAEHRVALFLPEKVTSSTPLDQLPMKDYQRQVLRESIQSFRSSDRAICFQEERPADQGAAEGARSLSKLLAEQDIVLVGEIRALVDGYTPWFHRVVTAAYVEVKNVFHGADVPSAPKDGDLVAVLYRGGRTRIDGFPLCGDPVRGFDRPFKGQEVVLGGQVWEADSNFFQDVVRFPIRGGEVLPQPLAVLSEGQLPVPLGELTRGVQDQLRENEEAQNVELKAEQRLAQEPNEIGRILTWANGERRSLLFVPQSVFDAKRLEELPSSVEESMALRLDIQRRPHLYTRNFQGGRVPECWPADPQAVPGSAQEPLGLATLLRKAGHSYLGIVEDVVEGWDPREKRVAQLATVRIEQTLTSRGMLPEETEVAVLVGGGRITVDGTPLCNEFRDGFYVPQAGDSVVIAGAVLENSGRFFEGYLFPVADGKVQPQPLHDLQAEQAPVALADLEVELQQQLRETSSDPR